MQKLFTLVGKLVEAYPQAVLGDVASRSPELFLSSKDLTADLTGR
ncbi:MULTISPECIES: hypothetical protein [unclassified Luteococcus]